jgi:hypothetical protein
VIRLGVRLIGYGCFCVPRRHFRVDVVEVLLSHGRSALKIELSSSRNALGAALVVVFDIVGVLGLHQPGLIGHVARTSCQCKELEYDNREAH